MTTEIFGKTSSKNLGLKTWVLAARPKTLTASFAPIFVAASLAWHFQKSWSTEVFVLCLLASLWIQIGTNFINDAMDFKKGADRKDRLGPDRVTASGMVSANTVIKAAGVCFGFALLCGIPLLSKGGLPILVIGLSSLLFGALYTAGPFPLAYVGLGDLFVFLYFGLIAVSGTFFLLTKEISSLVLVVGAQIGILCTSLIAINNLRDREQDLISRKRTLAVLLGHKASVTLLGISYAFTFLLQAVHFQQIGWFAFLPLATLPLAASIVMFLFRSKPSKAYNGLLAKASMVHLLFSLLFSVSYLAAG